MGFLDESVIINISKYIEAVTVPLQFITLFIEAGFILLLIKRNFSILFLMGAIILHLGIFITSGIFFWHWMAVDAIFLYIICTNYNSGWLFNLYSNASLKIISLLLILSTGTILEGEMLGWFDTKVNNVYIIEATDTNCEKYSLPPAFLSPYDFPISQNKFHFANKYPILVGGVGETGNKTIFEQINQSISTNDIAELFEKHGEIKSNPILTEELVFFFERYFANLNLARKKYLVPQILTAPHHIWNQSIGNIYNFQAPIQNINLIYMETYFDGNEIHTIKNDVILSVPIQTIMSSTCNN